MSDLFDPSTVWSDVLVEGPSLINHVAHNAIVAAYREMNTLLAGWIAWVALQDKDSPLLSQPQMNALFGEWVKAGPRCVINYDYDNYIGTLRHAR